MSAEAISRREFLYSATWATGAIWVSLGAILTACGRDDTTTSAVANGDCSDNAVTTYTNPGHSHTTIAMTSSQITAAVAGNYTLLGGSHSHTFTLSAGDFTTLQGGGTVTKTDNEADGHTITIAC